MCIVVNAHTMLEAVGAQSVNELRPDSEAAQNTEGGQDEIPCYEATTKVELLTVLHVGLAAEDEDDVDEGVDEGELPIALHPVLLRHDVAIVEELGLVVEEAGVVEARLRAVHAIDHDRLVYVIFEAHVVITVKITLVD